MIENKNIKWEKKLLENFNDRSKFSMRDPFLH